MAYFVAPRTLLLLVCCCLGPANSVVAVTPLPPEPLLTRVVPADSILCLQYSGLTDPVAGTANQTEQLLAEPEVQRFLREADQLIDSLIEQIPESNTDGPNRDQAQLIYRWAKRLLRCPWTLYLSDIQPSQDGGPPRFEAGWLVKLDDEVEACRHLIRQALGDRGSKLQTVTIAGVPCERWQESAAATPIFFGSKGNFLLVTAGKDSMTQMMARVKAEPPAWLADLARSQIVPRKLLLARVDVARIHRLVEQFAAPDVQRMWDTWGLSNLSEVQLLKGLDDRGLVIHGSLQASSLTGLFSLLDEAPLTNSELRMIPADVLRASAWRLSPTKTMSVIESLVTASDEDAAGEMKAALAQFRVQTRLGVREDLLEPLGDFGCFFQSPGGFMGIPNATFILALRDTARFESTHAQLLELLEAALANSANGRRQPKLATTKIGDQTIHYLSGTPISPAWCITESQLVVAISTMALQGYLSRDATAPSLVDDPLVAAQLGSGDGPLSLYYVDTQRVLQGLYQAVPMLMGIVSAQLQQQGIQLSPTLLPQWEGIRDHLEPSLAVVRRSKDGIEYHSQCTLPGGSVVSGSSPIMVALLLPAVQAARAASRRVQSTNNLRQIGLGILNYEAAYGRLPAPARKAKDGQSGLSWRVSILPYLAEQELYDQFHMDEPWDSPHNKTLLDRMPVVYRSPISSSKGGMTTYLAVVGNDGALGDAAATESTQLREIKDGTSNTVMLVEVNDDRGVPWTKPDDFAWDPTNPTNGLDKTHPGSILALFVDCSAQALSSDTSPETVKALFTKSGGEIIPASAP